MEWTMQAIATLRELWTQGHSASEIGHQMHTTKNSIVGKAHRLGLEARPSPIKPSGEPRPYPVRRLMPSSRTLPGLPSEATTCRYQGDWITEERKAVIKRDWPAYKHRAHILAELAQLPGPMWPSPEAVTSYVSSLGLHKPYGYRSPALLRASRHVPFAPRPAKPIVAKREPVPQVYARVTGCLWPIGDVGMPEFHFCDEPHRNKSYCNEHQAVAYVRVR